MLRFLACFSAAVLLTLSPAMADTVLRCSAVERSTESVAPFATHESTQDFGFVLRGAELVVRRGTDCDGQVIGRVESDRAIGLCEGQSNRHSIAIDRTDGSFMYSRRIQGTSGLIIMGQGTCTRAQGF